MLKILHQELASLLILRKQKYILENVMLAIQLHIGRYYRDKKSYNIVSKEVEITIALID